jgi:hypothetical protein
MKINLSILFCFFLWLTTFSQTYTSENVVNAYLSSDISTAQVNSLFDTSYVREVGVEISSLTGLQQVRVSVLKISTDSTLIDSLVSIPSIDLSTSDLLAVGRSGNQLKIKFGPYSLLERYRLRFYVIDSNNHQQKVYETEF